MKVTKKEYTILYALGVIFSLSLLGLIIFFEWSLWWLLLIIIPLITMGPEVTFSLFLGGLLAKALIVSVLCAVFYLGIIGATYIVGENIYGIAAGIIFVVAFKLIDYFHKNMNRKTQQNQP